MPEALEQGKVKRHLGRTLTTEETQHSEQYRPTGAGSLEHTDHKEIISTETRTRNRAEQIRKFGRTI